MMGANKKHPIWGYVNPNSIPFEDMEQIVKFRRIARNYVRLKKMMEEKK